MADGHVFYRSTTDAKLCRYGVKCKLTFSYRAGEKTYKTGDTPVEAKLKKKKKN